MKALDTPVLLALLEGDPKVRAHLKRWRGEELATTETNLLELAVIAGQDASRSRGSRGTALGRLRRRLTVLPLDSRAGDEIQRRVQRGGPLPPATVLGMLAALETSGCEELLTDDPSQIPGKWRFRVTRIGRETSKKSK